MINTKTIASIERSFDESRAEFIDVTSEAIFLHLVSMLRDRGKITKMDANWKTFPRKERESIESMAAKLFDNFKKESTVQIADAFEMFIMTLEPVFRSFVDRMGKMP